MNELDYEDVLLNGFEGADRENESLKQELVAARSRIYELERAAERRQQTRSHFRQQAEKYERLYRIVLQRNVILNRKIKELGD